MKKYTVFGHTEITVSTVVEANSIEEAIEKAEERFKGISSFCGNGGTDKLIGVNGEDDTISADSCVKFDDAAEE